MFKKIIAIGIWVNRFEFVEYHENGRLKTFKKYQQAWDFIVANNLPPGASAIEIYQPA